MENMMKMKLFCPNCDDYKDVTVFVKNETFPVKGEDITISANICVCSECGKEVFSLLTG